MADKKADEARMERELQSQAAVDDDVKISGEAGERRLPDLDPDELEARQLQSAADAQRAKQEGIDETVPGGRYLVDGAWVNAEGKPIKKP